MEGIQFNIKKFASDLNIDFEEAWNLYSEYLREVKIQITQASAYLQEKDWENLKKVIHNIKGLSSNYRIFNIFTEAEALDKELKNNVEVNARLYVDRLFVMVKNAENAIKNFFRENGIQI